MPVRIRELEAADLVRLGEIDRSEHVRFLYVHEQGELRRIEQEIDIPTWPEAMLAEMRERLAEKLAAGGVLVGALDGDRLVGAAVLGGKRLGALGNQLEVAFLYVSNGYRRQGLARRLLDDLARRARARGASQLYISASETDSAIGFYLDYGCEPAEEIDPELFALEPKDIHLTFDL
jgi:ribosomal protein S18 acetylase RimI-like enzyme